MKIELNADKTRCRINGDQIITVNQNIDYRSASEIKISVGKIKAFKFAGWKQCDRESVWMLIEDAVDASITEWISVRNWKEHFDSGIFGELRVKNQNTKTTENVSTKRARTGKRPF